MNNIFLIHPDDPDFEAKLEAMVTNQQQIISKKVSIVWVTAKES